LLDESSGGKLLETYEAGEPGHAKPFVRTSIGVQAGFPTSLCRRDRAKIELEGLCLTPRSEQVKALMRRSLTKRSGSSLFFLTSEPVFCLVVCRLGSEASIEQFRLRDQASTKVVAIQGVCSVVNEKGKAPVAARQPKFRGKTRRRPAIDRPC
jgi:hypothetical protein